MSCEGLRPYPVSSLTHNTDHVFTREAFFFMNKKRTFRFLLKENGRCEWVDVKNNNHYTSDALALLRWSYSHQIYS